MSDFKYVAKNAIGKTVNGVISSDNIIEAKNLLRGQGLIIISLSEKARGLARKSLAGGAARPKAKVKSKDLSVFTRQLATMVSAGIPLLESLEVLSEQADDPGFRYCLDEIVSDVRKGTDLSSAMAKHSKLFSNLYVNMIKAGEVSGQIDEILLRLAEYQEAADRLKSEIKSAMTYPIMSLTMVLGITIFLMLFIVPQFASIFSAMGAEDKLPLPTKWLLAVSNFMRERYYIWVSAVGLLVGGFILYSRTSGGSQFKDRLILRIPVLGPLFRKVAISRFARTFSTLLKSGVPILTTLEIVGTTSGNVVVRDAVMKASENIRDGEPLATPLARSGVFPPMVTRMIDIGERSGALETLLDKVSEFYDQEVKTTVEQLTSLIEPLLIGVMGFLVGGIVMAVFLPIFKMSSLVGK